MAEIDHGNHEAIAELRVLSAQSRGGIAATSDTELSVTSYRVSVRAQCILRGADGSLLWRSGRVTSGAEYFAGRTIDLTDTNRRIAASRAVDDIARSMVRRLLQNF